MKWRKSKRELGLIPPNNTFFHIDLNRGANDVNENRDSSRTVPIVFVYICSHMGISLRAYESWKIGTTITIGNSCPHCGNTSTHVKRVGQQQFETVPNV